MLEICYNMLSFVEGVSIINLFQHRNLALGCFLFIVTLFVCYYVNNAIMCTIGILSILLALLLWIIYGARKDKKLLNILIRHTPALILACIAVIIALLTFFKDREQLSYCDNKLHTIEGEAEEVVFSLEYYAGYIVRIDKIDGNECSYRVLLTDSTASLKKNNLFIGNASFNELSSKDIGFDQSQYYIADGILMSGEIEEYIHIEKGKNDIFDYPQEINAYLDGILKSKLNSDTYPIASALILGNRRLLSYDVNEDFARLGIVHILSLSGMHVSIIVTMLAFALSKARLSKLSQIIIVTATIVLFVGISGFCAPAIRAGIMQILFYLIFIFWEKSDAVTALFVSVTLICLFSPYLIFSLSLMLSFFAMLGCICSSKLYRRLNKKLRIKSKLLSFIISTTVTTIGVTFACLPLTYIYFGDIPLLSAPANILIVPLLNIVIYLIPFILIFSPIGFISNVLAYFCEVICSFVLNVCDYFASLEDIIIPIRGKIQLIGVIIICVSLALAIILSRKKLKIAFMGLCVGVIVLTVGIISSHIAREDNIYITSYSFARNDVICIEKNNDLTVIDISKHSLNTVFANDMSDYLGYSELENYIALTYSHKSYDYFDRMTDTVVIKHIYLTLPKTENEEKYFNECTSLLNGKEIEFSTFDGELSFDGIKLDVCSDMYISRSTKRSIVFNITVNDFNYTYMGASAFEIISTLPDKYAACADALAFGAYGPEYKREFKYETKNLDFAVFMGNSKEFANKEFLNRIYEKSSFYTPFTVRISN